MAFTKPSALNLSRVVSLFEATREYLVSPAQPTRMDAPLPRLSSSAPAANDRLGYERLLETELDCQHFTAVEREEIETLERVRSAIYAE